MSEAVGCSDKETRAGRSARSSHAAAWVIPTALLVLHAALLMSSAMSASVTADEPLHLLAGYSSLALRDYGFSQQHHHPALGTMLNAVPLLFVKDLHVPPTAKQGGNPQPWKTQFIYEQHIPGDRLLLYCRIPTMLLSMALALTVYLCAMRLYGTAAGCFALGLHVLSPNILAHGQLITTDMIASLLIFSTCWALWRHLVTRRRTWFLSAAVLAGAAMAAKLSSVVLVPVFAAALAWKQYCARAQAKASWWTLGRRWVSQMLAAGLIAFAAIWCAYGFETGPYFDDAREHPTFDRLFPSGAPRAAALHLLHDVPLPLPSYVRCWSAMRSHQGAGQWAFLHGQYSRTGWWYYYLAAAGVKTPLALVALLVLGLVVCRSGRIRVTPAILTLTLPVVLMLVMSVTSTQNIGLRHILPMYAFLHVAAARSVQLIARPIGAVALVVLASWYGASALRVHPYELAYFNEIAGGPANGYRWLVDSNLDWGQDLKRLAAYVSERRLGRISLAYFGNARPEYYGIDYERMPVALGLMQTRDPLPRPTPGIVAISATELQDVYSDDKRRYAWLRELTPIDSVGYSILIYDLGPQRAARR